MATRPDDRGWEIRRGCEGSDLSGPGGEDLKNRTFLISLACKLKKIIVLLHVKEGQKAGEVEEIA